MMTTPTIVFWDGSPLAETCSILGILNSDMSEELVERLSNARDTSEYRVMAAAVGCDDWRLDAFDDATSSSTTFHLAYFRDKLQVSFGERGFVPLAHLLDYNSIEMTSYLSLPRRIHLAHGSLGASEALSPAIH